MLLIEVAGADSMLFVEEQAVFPVENAGSRRPPDKMADGVTEDCGNGKGRNQGVDVELTSGSKQSGGDEQGIAGKKNTDQ